MVCALAALVAIQTQSQTPFPVFELPDPMATNIIFQVIMKTPPLMRSEHADWVVMANSVLDGVEDFSNTRIRELTRDSGLSPRVIVMNDHVRIVYAVTADQLAQGSKLATMILSKPKLRQDSVTKAIGTLSEPISDPFSAAVLPQTYDFSKVNEQSVQRTFATRFDPKNSIVVVGGAVTPGLAAQEMARWTRVWEPKKVVSPVAARIDPPEPLLRSRIGVSSFEFRGKPFTPATPFSGSMFLATIALGMGKASTLWRVVRQEMGLSYVQEGLLWPTTDGWVPRFIVLRGSEESEVELFTNMRTNIIADIDKWDEAHLARSQSLAKASLERGSDLSPFWIAPDESIQPTLEDRCAWIGLLELTKTGAVGMKTLSSALENVDLESVKDQAKKMIESAEGVYINGR